MTCAPPLAAAKAAVTSLRSADVELERRGPRRTAGHRRRVAGDPLAHLVGNLLDMSRLEALRAVGVPPAGGPGRDRRALAGRPGSGRTDHRRGYPRLPARGGRGPGHPGAGHREPDQQRAALLAARRTAEAVRELTRRPGRAAGGSTAAPASRRPTGCGIFVLFQRLGDNDNTTGVGLGLALSRGSPRPWGARSTRRRHRAAG